MLQGELNIDDELYRTNKGGTSLKKSLEDTISNKLVTQCIDLTNLVVQVIILIVYIWRTWDMCLFDKNPVWKYYLDEEGNYYDKECGGEAETWYYIILFVLHMYLFLEFLLRAFTQKYYMKFLFTMDSLIEILTTVPFIILYLSVGTHDKTLQFFIMMDQWRFFLFKRFSKNIENELQREFTDILIKICVNCVVFTCFLQHIENEYNYNLQTYEPMSDIHYQFYFTITTISTVGYGSHVKSMAGRISIIGFILTVVVVLPNQCTRLVQLVNSKSYYARAEYDIIKDVPHIVLIGSVTTTSLSNFLEEYQHEDHDAGQRHCVLMMPTRPDPQTELIMMKPRFMTTLFYIEGSTLD